MKRYFKTTKSSDILEQVPNMHMHFANNPALVDDNGAPHMANIVHKCLTGADIMQID